MRAGRMHRIEALAGILGLLAPLAPVHAQPPVDPLSGMLTYETIQPSHIKLGESATIRVTALDGYLPSVRLPTVPGLTFELLGRAQGVDVVNGKTAPAAYILIKVTPQSAGLFSIPGVTARSRPLTLDVLKPEETDPYEYHPHDKVSKPLPVAPVPIPKGIELKAGDAAFVRLVVPSRIAYVGQSVPVDIEAGARPYVVTAVNGLPALTSDDFTLNNLSQHPKSTEQLIKDSRFQIWTWHSVIAAVKPGDFSLSAKIPLMVKINPKPESDVDLVILAKLGGPFLQSTYSKIVPKEMTVVSPASPLQVLPLPGEGRPKDFSGAVGEFQASSDISPAKVSAGEPLTLRLHIRGAGNFDRVDSPMFDHLDHWKAYPPKSSFTKAEETGYKGEKVFEQPLIPAEPGEHIIPALEFSYFNPVTRHYERAFTQPLKVTIGASLADRSLREPAAGQGPGALTSSFARALRPDRPQPQRWVSDMRPLYFQTPFLAVPIVLVLTLAGCWLVIRPAPVRHLSKSARRALARLEAAAQSGDSALFFDVARTALVQAFAARWRLSAEQITLAELNSRLKPAGEDIERLWALADELKYADRARAGTDFRHWISLVRGQLTDGSP
jgi:hypothetical protein